MQDYQYSDVGQLQTSNFGENEFEGSRAFRRAVNDAGYLGVSEDDLNGSRWNDGWIGNRAVGWDAETVKASGEEQFHNQRELRVLTDIYAKAVNDLYKSQSSSTSSTARMYGKTTSRSTARTRSATT